MTVYLSPHFSIAELTHSQAATRLGVLNEPGVAQLDNLRRLADVLETVRSAVRDLPVLISSGFRAPAVNREVGGAANSAHIDGRAADFTVPRFGSPKAVCQRIVDAGIVFDQLIYEGAWVHLGIAVRHEPPRREVLTAIFETGRPTRYLKGLQ
ncbi:D-Ala-D-Ala carboxypeptidase family metallohydrolase [uncultured Pseudacidovorax sp.]|uniref:D-Ala-D-Ala carboxypeptidase family metallohydrolase n=1 Tax=uncultured Pseudacidovorax sp. TaxID=679313 RepID=UPI0025CFB55A|nr:D-Ala-D-Ala carboxypeptidase family metallohydrolase [uncultured Pseudacidovorax sp.]